MLGMNRCLDRFLFRLVRRFIPVMARVPSSDGWLTAPQLLHR